MADDVDKASEHEQFMQELNIDTIRMAASKIPTGEPGDCDLCGEWFGRLVAGVCAPCRDRRGLP